MSAKRIFQLVIVMALLVTSLVSTNAALAKSGGCANYITVQWGDTLSGLAATCGTTVAAIRAANPSLGWWIYAGQVLCIPSALSAPAPAASTVYIAQSGDTLGSIAIKFGYSLNDVIAANPQIWNPSWIYAGQAINIPAGASVPPPVYYPAPPVYVSPSNDVAALKVTYGNGLLVRMGPGKEYAEIRSALVSAVVDTKWQYRKSSISIDTKGNVWVEVALNPLTQGYTIGWILVRDTLGNYFTEPKIDS